MKAPRYITKRVYIERNLEREYHGHMKRLEKIKSSHVNPCKKIDYIEKLQTVSKQNHQRAVNFQEEEKSRFEKVENKALIGKLLEINDGKYSVIRQPSQTASNGMQDLNGKKSTRASTQPQLGPIGSLQNVARKREEERINKENQALAQRMIRLPPVISKKKLEKEFKKNKGLGDQILRYHIVKDKALYVTNSAAEEQDDNLDMHNDLLMEQSIELTIQLENAEFKNILPREVDEELYFLSVKACTKPEVETSKEKFSAFCKTQFKIMILLKELKRNKVVLVGVHRDKDGESKFLGDFEIDLTEIFKSDFQGTSQVLALRNHKEFRNLPNYMHKDMRKKGDCSFSYSVKSDVEKLIAEGFGKEEKKEEDKNEDKEVKENAKE